MPILPDCSTRISQLANLNDQNNPCRMAASVCSKSYAKRCCALTAVPLECSIDRHFCPAVVAWLLATIGSTKYETAKSWFRRCLTYRNNSFSNPTHSETCKPQCIFFAPRRSSCFPAALFEQDIKAQNYDLPKAVRTTLA